MQIALYTQSKIQEKKLFSPTLQLVGHQGEIDTLKFSDDGDFLASAGYDKLIFLWDVFDPQCKNVLALKGHTNAILDLCWSLDSTRLYSCGADRTVCIWDLIEGKRLKKYKGHEGTVNCVNAVKRGPELIVSGGDDFNVNLWDHRVRECVQNLKVDYQITSCTFNSTNDYVYFGGLDNQIKAWNLRKNEVEFSLLGHTDTITGLSLSHNGNYLLSNSMDYTVRAWDLRPYVMGPRWVRTFTGATHNFEKNLLRCCWSKDDSSVSAGSADRFVYIWDFDSQEIVSRLGGHMGSVNETSLHPKQKIIASGSSDKNIYIGEYGS